MTNPNINRPWFKKTEVIVALIGVIFPFLITYFINSFDKDKKEILITYSQLEPLISESNEIINKLVINYDSAGVRNISKLTIRLKNTGNQSLTKADFIDGPINIKVLYQNENSSIILQAREKEDAGQQNSSLAYKNLKKNFSEITYNPSLLNPNDEVVLEAYLLNTPNIKIFSKGKILNGQIFGPNPLEIKEDKVGYKNFILSLNSFFINKWLTTIVLIILFFFLALSTIFQVAMARQPAQRDSRYLIRNMAIVTGLLSLLIITLIVSILLIV